jgi:arginyl-tRNA synthetase
MFDSEIAVLTSNLKAALDRVGIPYPDEFNWSPTPFRGQWGAGTPIAFQAASLEGKEGNVQARAREIAEIVVGEAAKPTGFDRIEAHNGYINGYFDTAAFAQRVVDTALELGGDYGRGDPKDERVMVEFAQPNTHHSIHIGHARNFILGESLARMVEYLGYETIRASYPGDIGLGVMTTVWAYSRFHEGREPEGTHTRSQWLSDIYSEAHALVEAAEEETPQQRSQREQYDQERRELYRAWDRGDTEVRELWQKTRQWSLDELDDILQMLGASIDVYFFESEVDEPAKQIVEELIAQGIAEDERPDGPVLVKIDEKLGLEKERYRTIVLLRQDGTTLYSAKDLALAKSKFEQHEVDRSIYVVDVRQSLHFQQVFKILELWGFPQASKCYHLAYGFVSLPEGAMSSRHGNVVWFKDVADEAERRASAIIAEKNPSLSGQERQRVARQVGLGALAYALVSVDNVKDIVFRWETALNFEGQSAPYIQNAHVRANSILRKAGELPSRASFDYALEPHEAELIDRISRFPETVVRAGEEYKPLHMSNYAYELAKSFHAFYHAVPVIQSEKSRARLRLTAAARQVLANSLNLLAIEAPSVM